MNEYKILKKQDDDRESWERRKEKKLIYAYDRWGYEQYQKEKEEEEEGRKWQRRIFDWLVTSD